MVEYMKERIAIADVKDQSERHARLLASSLRQIASGTAIVARCACGDLSACQGVSIDKEAQAKLVNLAVASQDDLIVAACCGALARVGNSEALRQRPGLVYDLSYGTAGGMMRNMSSTEIEVMLGPLFSSPSETIRTRAVGVLAFVARRGVGESLLRQMADSDPSLDLRESASRLLEGYKRPR